VAIDPNWARWIRASVDKHFVDLFAASSLATFVEGQHRATRSLKDFVEVRMDGPDISEVSKNYYVLRVDVSILIHSTMDDTNYHRIDASIGITTAAFSTVKVYRYGTPGDDTLLGCLTLQDELQVLRYGQRSPDKKLQHASVEGHYKMTL